MEKATLKPFLRENLDILFVGLNPARISNKKGHYFSVKQSFWKQLHQGGLISEDVNKDYADDLIFGGDQLNFNQWNYGITDLVTHIAESNSTKVEPTVADCKALKDVILQYKPLTVVILHGKVLKEFVSHYIGGGKYYSNSGKMGQLLKGCNSVFYNIAFPHGNSISDANKIKRYKELKSDILKVKK